MNTTLLQPQKLPPANDGHVRDSLTADERLLRKAVQRVLKAQVAEVHGKVEGGAKSNAVPEKTTKWDQEVMREVRPIWFGLFKKGGDRALRNIRRFPKHARKMAVLSWAEMQASERVEVKSLKSTPSVVIPEWIEDPDVLDALEREMFKFAHGINQTTADDLRTELLAGMENGETISQLADRISSLSDEWVEGWRSEMIARTETARAFSTGHIEAWRSTGVVSRVVWTAAGDACPFCQQMDGTVIELGENFFDQGEEQTVAWKGQEIVMEHDYSDVNGPPLHPNCYLHHTVMVTTDAGKKMISKIKVGDRVLTARGRFRPVTRVLEKASHYKGRAVRIMYRGWKDWGFTNRNSVTITPEHPFLTDSGWKAAQDITPNDSLYVLATYCPSCGKKIPFWRKYCSDECVFVDQPEIGEKISKVKKQRNWMKGRTGALHHGWRGGKIWWRGKDWDVLKRKIVERDGFMCQDCGMTEEACLEKSGQPLHVHHLNPYRDSFDNSPQNLITLCVSCHAKREGTVNSRFLKRGGVSFIDIPVLAVQHIDNFKGERLYNFSVAEDESYVAQGIVNHNCRCVLVAELDEEKAIKKGLPIL